MATTLFGRWDDIEAYSTFARSFVQKAVEQSLPVVYLRFASHSPVVPEDWPVSVQELNPRSGFDVFCADLHGIIEKQGPEVFYVFDNLSALVSDWGTDELLANFFQVTCPFLFELNTVAYFALIRSRH